MSAFTTKRSGIQASSSRRLTAQSSPEETENTRSHLIVRDLSWPLDHHDQMMELFHGAEYTVCSCSSSLFGQIRRQYVTTSA